MPKDRTKRLFVGMTSIKGIFQELFFYKNMSRKDSYFGYMNKEYFMLNLYMQ